MSSATYNGQMSRLEAFSDAVFAFAATLLVVSLQIPNTVPELVADLEGFVAFGLSFFALVLIWSVHNAFFRRYELQDRWTIILNNCLLFVVLLYVFPLKFVAEGLAVTFGLANGVVHISSRGEMSTLFMLYSAGFVAVFLCVALLYLHVWRGGGKLGVEPDDKNEARFYFRHYMILAGTGVASVLIAWLKLGISFGLPGLVYFLLWPLCIAHSRWSSKH